MSNGQRECRICGALGHWEFEHPPAERAAAREGLSEERIAEIAYPFIRSLGGDAWASGEDGIRDSDNSIEDFARAIEAAHGIAAPNAGDNQ